MIGFDAPAVLWIAPIVAVVVGALAVWARHARISRAGKWSPGLAQQARGAGRMGSAILAAIAGIATVALAGPRWGSRVVETQTKGLNLVVVVDISRSMLAEDVAPSRLEHVRRQVHRLVHDLDGDRIGLIAFAGQSFVLSPLTVDAAALQLLVDALDPSLTSAGGTALAAALRQGRGLLFAGDQVADRVLVVFTDGEAHDSSTAILEEAKQLDRDGVRVIMVAVGGRTPVPIPVRSPDGAFIGNQRDPSDEVVLTARRDDILNAVADAAQGLVVVAEHRDQAGAVRNLVASYKRAPQATTTAAEDLSRAWIPLMVATLLLLGHTLTRRTMALAGLLLTIVSHTAMAQGPRDQGEESWRSGDFAVAAQFYLKMAMLGEGGDTAWFNAGTAALAVGDTAVARSALGRAAGSLEPEVRFKALYNLGLMYLRLGISDSTNARQLLAAARDAYREALLLRPADRAAKWNFELALRSMPPPPGGTTQPPPSNPSEVSGADSALAGLTLEQAEQILNSMAEEERRTRLEQNRRRNNVRETRGRKEW